MRTQENSGKRWRSKIVFMRDNSWETSPKRFKKCRAFQNFFCQYCRQSLAETSCYFHQSWWIRFRWHLHPMMMSAVTSSELEDRYLRKVDVKLCWHKRNRTCRLFGQFLLLPGRKLQVDGSWCKVLKLWIPWIKINLNFGISKTSLIAILERLLLVIFLAGSYKILPYSVVWIVIIQIRISGLIL